VANLRAGSSSNFALGDGLVSITNKPQTKFEDEDGNEVLRAPTANCEPQTVNGEPD
jgi:hypothetical protein